MFSVTFFGTFGLFNLPCLSAFSVLSALSALSALSLACCWSKTMHSFFSMFRTPRATYLTRSKLAESERSILGNSQPRSIYVVLVDVPNVSVLCPPVFGEPSSQTTFSRSPSFVRLLTGPILLFKSLLVLLHDDAASVCAVARYLFVYFALDFIIERFV